MSNIYTSADQLTGRTPLLELTRLEREEGLEALRDAKAAHDAMEAVYQPHVDFEGVDRCVARELARIEEYASREDTTLPGSSLPSHRCRLDGSIQP